MKVLHDFESINPKCFLRPTVIAFGSFDGIHLGHRALLSRVRAVAEKKNYLPIVLTFANHPLSVLAPPYCPELLMRPERKTEVLAQLGMFATIIPYFTKEISQITAEKFVREFLLQRLNMRYLVCGYDCRFGHKGAGNSDLLRREGIKLGFEVEVAEAKRSDGVIVGSTLIRELLSLGQVDKAMEFLERPHELRGTVVSGDKRGRKLDFPTANLQFEREYSVPGSGVYVIWADFDKRRYGGMMNLGHRPTLGQKKYVPEAHLFNFNQSVYGKKMDVYFLERLRDEKKFENLEALKKQLNQDREKALSVLRRY